MNAKEKEKEEEALFLATAYKFLSEISYGKPAHNGHSPIPPPPIGGIILSPCKEKSYHSGGEAKPTIVSGQVWLQTILPQSPNFYYSKILLLSINGKVPSCSLSIKGHVPKSIRKRRELTTTTNTNANTNFSLTKSQEEEDFSNDRNGGNHFNTIFQRKTRKTQSYQHLLLSSSTIHQQDLTVSLLVSPACCSSPLEGGKNSNDPDESYDANFLDNPELRTGKHRTVIALTSFLGSINHFTKAEFLKRELNEKFRKLHPNVNQSLTLSQIRNLKKKLLSLAVNLDLELSTVARSYTFLEKLILNRLIEKRNRKVVGGCCLLLATKATDAKATNYSQLVSRLSVELQVSRKELVELEFAVFAALKFRLQVSEEQYESHLTRILTHLDYSNLQEYLGERMHENWQHQQNQHNILNSSLL